MEKWYQNIRSTMDLGDYGFFWMSKVIIAGKEEENSSVKLYAFVDYNIADEHDEDFETLLCARVEEDEEKEVYYVAQTDLDKVHNFIRKKLTFKEATLKPYFKATYYKKEERWEHEKIRRIPEWAIKKIQRPLERTMWILD